MQITILALGSRGDVQPYVALGKGLREAGHTVRILATQEFQSLITAYDLEFFDVGGSMETVARGMQALIEQGNMLKIMARMGTAAEQMANQAAAAGLAACQSFDGGTSADSSTSADGGSSADGSTSADLIIAGLGGLFVGMALSEKLGLPFIPAYLYPFTPTREFPSVLMPLPQTRLTMLFNRQTHRLAQQMMWQATRTADNKSRRQVLHIAPAPFWGPFDGGQGQQTILYGYSPQVIPIPGDWNDSLHVTGYWFLESPAGWEPPGELASFLQSGPPPVYIGFGSMPGGKPEETADLVIQALARTGQRGVLSAGWGGLKKDDLPETVCMVGSLPHDWLFPRMAAVVHHGGVGTTAAGLRAGVPNIVTPYFGDQPFWGQRVYELGGGPRPIPRRRLTVDRLAEAIRSAVTDPAMRERAAHMGERIRAEDGVANAVAVIEQVMGR